MSALCLVASGYSVPGFLGYYFYDSAKFLFQTGNKKIYSTNSIYCWSTSKILD